MYNMWCPSPATVRMFLEDAFTYISQLINTIGIHQSRATELCCWSMFECVLF